MTTLTHVVQPKSEFTKTRSRTSRRSPSRKRIRRRSAVQCKDDTHNASLQPLQERAPTNAKKHVYLQDLIHTMPPRKKATLTFRMFEIQQFEPARPLERPFQIPQHVVDLTARGVRVSETTTSTSLTQDVDPPLRSRLVLIDSWTPPWQRPTDSSPNAFPCVQTHLEG